MEMSLFVFLLLISTGYSIKASKLLQKASSSEWSEHISSKKSKKTDSGHTDEEIVPIKFHRNFKKSDCYLGTETENRCYEERTVSSWYHGKCQLRPYGGCNPTRNNFETHIECLTTAAIICNGIGGGILESIQDSAKAWCPISSLCSYIGLHDAIPRSEGLEEAATSEEIKKMLHVPGTD